MAIHITNEALESVFPGIQQDVLILCSSDDVRSWIAFGDRRAPKYEISLDAPESHDNLRHLIAEQSGAGHGVSVVWIASAEYRHFPKDELLDARAAAISFFSSAPSEQLLNAYWEIVRLTDYGAQAEAEKHFFDFMDEAEFLTLRDPRFDVTATLRHQKCQHWFSLNGPLHRGAQTVLPTGEVSILTDPSGEYSTERLLPMQGELVLQAEPLVHRGDNSTPREGVQRLYGHLSCLRDSPTRVTVEDGTIAKVEPLGSTTDGAGARALEALFSTDERYRKIHELGFGTNCSCRPLHGGNFFPDERYPGTHYGLGLGHHLPLHIDLVCPHTELYAHFPPGSSRDVLRGIGVK